MGFAEAGIDVTHYVRKGKSTTYKDGVELDLLDKRKGHKKYNLTKYALKCVEEISPSDKYEIIIILTNSYQPKKLLRRCSHNQARPFF
jgi:hypothetical protein